MYQVVVMLGRLVEDPDLRQTPNGVSVAVFRIAVDRPYKKEGTSVADFFDVVAWRELGEFVAKHFRKGKPILVQGRFETRSWKDKEGQKRYRTELIAERISFTGDSSGKDKPPLPEAPPEHGEPKEAPKPSAGPDDFEEVPSDDDLPF